MAYFDFINTYTSSTPGSLYTARTRSPFSYFVSQNLGWDPSKVPWQLCSAVKVLSSSSRPNLKKWFASGSLAAHNSYKRFCQS